VIDQLVTAMNFKIALQKDVTDLLSIEDPMTNLFAITTSFRSSRPERARDFDKR